MQNFVLEKMTFEAAIYTPNLSGRIIMVWHGRLSVCPSVHKACKHDTD